jgi:hypothetical protein
MKMVPFRFGAPWFDRGIKHPAILGAFNKSGVPVAVRLASGECEWKRYRRAKPVDSIVSCYCFRELTHNRIYLWPA